MRAAPSCELVAHALSGAYQTSAMSPQLLPHASACSCALANGKQALPGQSLWLCSASSTQPPGPRAFKFVAVGHAHAEHELALGLARRYLGEHKEQLARHVCTGRGGRQCQSAGTAQACFGTQVAQTPAAWAARRLFHVRSWSQGRQTAAGAPAVRAAAGPCRAGRPAGLRAPSLCWKRSPRRVWCSLTASRSARSFPSRSASSSSRAARAASHPGPLQCACLGGLVSYNPIRSARRERRSAVLHSAGGGVCGAGPARALPLPHGPGARQALTESAAAHLPPCAPAPAPPGPPPPAAPPGAAAGAPRWP